LELSNTTGPVVEVVMGVGEVDWAKARGAPPSRSADTIRVRVRFMSLSLVCTGDRQVPGGCRTGKKKSHPLGLGLIWWAV